MKFSLNNCTVGSVTMENGEVAFAISANIHDQSDRNISILSAYAGTDESFNLIFEGEGEPEKEDE